jgi:hypothetical protein
MNSSFHGSFFICQPFASNQVRKFRIFISTSNYIYYSLHWLIMEVICLSDEAFYALIETVVARIKEKEGIKG